MRNLLTLLALVTAFVLFDADAKSPVLILSSSNTVSIVGPISVASVNKASVEILSLHAKLPKGKSIILFLDTPGGSISAGNSLIELIQGLPRKVVTVTAFAASMGYQIVQSLGTRYVLESGTLMSHRASIGGLSGQVPGEANTRLSWISEIVEELEVKTAKRVRMSTKAYKELIRDELWLTGSKAVATYHADKVVKIRCDSSMLGTYDEKINTMFGAVNVTFHKCPMISGPIKVVSDDEGMDSIKFEQAKEEVNGWFSRKKGIWTF